MNRELKFRAWDGNEMLTMPMDGTYGLHRFFGFIDGVAGNKAKVMQYTGLKDKNGVEIYEGDIIGFFRKHIAIKFSVVFKDGMFTSKYLTKGSIEAKQRLQECSKDGISYNGLPANLIHGGRGNPWEVIGNIHANPELLEAS